jgi:hypothetical protein
MERIIFLLILVLSITLVNASLNVGYDDEETPGINIQTFKQGTNINITVPCSYNNTQCSSGAICNITVFNPSYEVIHNDTLNVNSGSFFSIYLNETITDDNGDYIVSMFCVDQSVGDASNFKFNVNPSGFEPSISQNILYVIFLVIMIFLFLLTMYGFVKIKWKHSRDEEGKILSVSHLRYLKPMLFFFCYFEGLFISALLYGIARNYLEIPMVSNFFYTVYSVLLTLLIPLAPITFLVIVISIAQDKKIMKVFEKQAKENAKKAKIEAQIKAAQDKLAKLTAKLA